MKSVNANRNVILASILKAVSAGQQQKFPQNSLHLLTAFNFPNFLPSMSSRLLGGRCPSPQREGHKPLVLRSFNSVTCFTVSSFHQGEILLCPFGDLEPKSWRPNTPFLGYIHHGLNPWMGLIWVVLIVSGQR